MAQTHAREFKQLLLCGLDFSGKTTLIKHYAQDLNEFAGKAKRESETTNQSNPNFNSEMFTTTPYINIEKIKLPESSMDCVVYDLSGQVSIFQFHPIMLGTVPQQLVLLLP